MVWYASVYFYEDELVSLACDIVIYMTAKMPIFAFRSLGMGMIINTWLAHMYRFLGLADSLLSLMWSNSNS